MTWFRRVRDSVAEPHAAPPAASAAEDDPAQLRATLFTVNRFVNQNAGQLPEPAVVLSRLITDTVREVLDTAEMRPLDIHTTISIQGIISDYLPTTLRQYLALNQAQRLLPRATGLTPVQSLREQLEAMLGAAYAVLVASRDADADALMAQGTFLRTKFTRSDLDL